MLIYGDYLLGHTAEAVEIETIDFGPLPGKPWAVDGTLGGSGKSRNLNPIGMEKGSKGIEPARFWRQLVREGEAHRRLPNSVGKPTVLQRTPSWSWSSYSVRSGDSCTRRCEAFAQEGYKVGVLRPVTLWPFPREALVVAARGTKRVVVLEQNAGQMIDDVQLSLLGSAPITAIGGMSTDGSGFGVGPILDQRFASQHRARDAS